MNHHAVLEKRKLEHEAELRWLYGVRAQTEPRIRLLEQILDRPMSNREWAA
jgi:hypothetical protein